MSTCQICGREIKSKSGLIAHHGYQRPGQGWQTASCFGARWRPYEVACDAIPPSIKAAESVLNGQQSALEKWIANPPETIIYQRRDTWGQKRGPEKVFNRPDEFDPQHREKYQYTVNDYVHQYFSQVTQFEQRIKFIEHDLKVLRQRLADWKPQSV